MADTPNHPSAGQTVTALPPFAMLFAQYEKVIFNMIYRLVGDIEDATDLTSQTFLHAFRAYHRFRGDAQVYTWLYRIAVNVCKNHFRSCDRQAQWHTVSLDAPITQGEHPIVWDIEDLTHSPEVALENQELQAVIQQGLLSLSTDLRTVILLRDVQGLSYQEIAEITGCSLEAVKSRIFRARGHLRKILGPYLQTSDDNTSGKLEMAIRKN